MTQPMSSSSGSDRMKKGTVNVAETGSAAWKRRTALRARDDARASETSYLGLSAVLLPGATGIVGSHR
jgi:hypothetical protein